MAPSLGEELLYFGGAIFLMFGSYGMWLLHLFRVDEKNHPKARLARIFFQIACWSGALINIPSGVMALGMFLAPWGAADKSEWAANIVPPLYIKINLYLISTSIMLIMLTFLREAKVKAWEVYVRLSA